ncbi:MAG: hypothetical protein HOQ11_08820 [Gemmatimonadaceae bacterium]|nr:hypothetical protein [Gemmatimonadaceae bacterium]NUQ91287.1 hypothetical protein [Gemmatimonadaceae bacterium]NUR21063.1 hypothetical protein [Gemmatimonadaceae bacterium]NUS97496.1 hypothetical protein [Gemmatimonadaceae bacterium]
MSPSSTVLLLSQDAMALALLGLLVELADLTPVFAEEGEHPEDALNRVRPAFVVVVDDTMDEVRSDLFFARAAQRKVGLAIFAGRGSRRELAPEIGRRGIPYFEPPVDVDDLARILRTAWQTEWWRRSGDRRALPAAERTAERGLVFVDRTGRHWQVYDRRGSDRRQHAPGGDAAPSSSQPITRVFVNEQGDSVSTHVAAHEVPELGVEHLERQFLRASAG